MDPGKARAVCGSRGGGGARSDASVPGGTDDATVAGSRDKTGSL